MILAIFSFSLFAQDIPKLNKNKFTICSATINSSEEVDLFTIEAAKYPKSINPVVELTNFGGTDWLQKACDSGIKCDQLIISGHHSSGEFYGNKRLRIDDEQLAKMGCAKQCKGILSQPLEVFLFACTTMSNSTGKEEINLVKSLVSKGIPLSQARLINNIQSGSEESSKEKFKQAFGGELKRIHGFKVRAPLGNQVESYLKKYFSNKNVNYLQNLQNLKSSRENHQMTEVNKMLSQAMLGTTMQSCLAGGGEGKFMSDIKCKLNSSELSTNKKIDLILKLAQSPKFLGAIPHISSSLDNNSEYFTKEQKEELGLLTKNKVIASQIRGLIVKLSYKELEALEPMMDFGHRINAFKNFKSPALEKTLLTATDPKTQTFLI